jgi:predicted O-linked N-acetylglucosamine transferase (SPINDLY family)
MNPQEIFGRALGAHRSGNLDEAARLYAQLLKRDRSNYPVMQMLGVLRAQQNQTKEAIALFRQALKFSRSPELFCNLGNVLHTIGRQAEAIQNYAEALKLRPEYGAALNGRGIALLTLGHVDRAIQSFDSAIAINPRDMAALANRGDAQRLLGHPSDALESYGAALKLAPQDPVLHYSRAFVQQQLGNVEEALAGYDRAIALNPEYPEALYNRGIVLERADKPEAALDSYERALIHHPAFPEALHRAGLVLQTSGRYSESLVRDEKAVALRPDFAEAKTDLGNVLRTLNRHDAALQCYAEALALKPDYAEALNNWGIALLDLRQFQQALDQFDRAIAIDPGYASAYYNRGNALRELKRLDDAIASYEKAYTLDRKHPYVIGALAGAALFACDWGRTEQFVQTLPGILDRPDVHIPPLVLLGYSDDPALHRKCAERAIEIMTPNAARQAPPCHNHQRPRVAYLSCDFNQHATSYLIAGMLEHHDRNNFDIFAVSCGPNDRSDLRNRIEAAVEHFVEAYAMSDADVARYLKEREVDIAVDLDGHTVGARLGILSTRPCPVQMTYLGYPATTGAGFIDYIIGDAVVTPLEDQPRFTERILQLPLCYQPSTANREVAATRPERAANGLPGDGVVFCCFNNSWKITGVMFAVWMRILKRVSGSVLWLLGDNELAVRNLRMEAARAGVDPDRLVFGRRAALAEHLGRHGCADIVLDTFPYNAHTTANDALFMGVPVVTMMGRSFPSRVAASQLTAVGLPELITGNAAAYENLAFKLATDVEYLNALRRRLASDSAKELFNEARMAGAMENLFLAALTRIQGSTGPV